MADYTCFFISPIGEPNTPERRHSDFMMKRIIVPALRLCNFREENIVRSDNETTTGKISESMMNHLQNDDLCIVDLAGSEWIKAAEIGSSESNNQILVANEPNPNVMYEYGFRNGVEKPIIALAPKGTELPFDVQDMRTIMYELTLDGIFDTQEQLEKMILQFSEAGFMPKQGTGTISDILNRLNDIDRKLNRALPSGPDAGPSDSSVEKVLRELGSPISAFNYALKMRNMELAEGLMPRLKRQIDKKSYIDEVVEQVTMLGSEKAAQELEDNWEYVMTEFDFQEKFEAIGCFITYCNRRDIEPEKLEFVTIQIGELLKETSADEQKAALYNQINRIYFGAYSTITKKTGECKEEYLDKAIEALNEAVKLDQDASYYYNLATCYRKKELPEKARDAIDRCLDLSRKDADHLKLAYQIYSEAGLDEKAETAKTELQAINPYMAAML